MSSFRAELSVLARNFARSLGSSPGHSTLHEAQQGPRRRNTPNSKMHSRGSTPLQRKPDAAHYILLRTTCHSFGVEFDCEPGEGRVSLTGRVFRREFAVSRKRH